MSAPEDQLAEILEHIQGAGDLLVFRTGKWACLYKL